MEQWPFHPALSLCLCGLAGLPAVLGRLAEPAQGRSFGPGRFVGLGNYTRVLADPVFLQALRNSIIFVLVSVPSLVALGLFLAIALNKTTRTTSFLRGLFFSSSVLSVTIVTLIWRFVFIPGDGLWPSFLNSSVFSRSTSCQRAAGRCSPSALPPSGGASACR